MKKISINDLEALMETKLYVVEICRVKACNKAKAEMYIEGLRKLHNELGCFIRYTCQCSALSGAVTWYFLYQRDEHEALNINKQTNAIWNNIFPENPANEEFTNGAHGSVFDEPCACPFAND